MARGVLLGLAVLAAACGDDAEPDRALAATRDAVTTSGDAIAAADQRTDGADVWVDTVTFVDAAGYVAVYADAGGVPGVRLGATRLLATGTHSDIAVPLDEDAGADTSVFVVAHAERSGDDALQWPGPDQPLTRDDGTTLEVRVDLVVDR